MARYFVIISRYLCLSRETNSINTLWMNESISWPSCFYPLDGRTNATTRLRPLKNFPPAGHWGGDLICLLISLLAPINGRPFRTPIQSRDASGSDWAALLNLLGAQADSPTECPRYQYYYSSVSMLPCSHLSPSICLCLFSSLPSCNLSSECVHLPDQSFIYPKPAAHARFFPRHITPLINLPRVK